MMKHVIFIALVLASVAADAGEMQMAWRRDNQDVLMTLKPEQGVISHQPLTDELTAPLGSVWKLFVYAWLTDNNIAEAPYHCTGSSPEEVYCCSAGQSIGREQALVQSCGLYFSPARWHIAANEWRQYWQQHGGPGWLSELDLMQPATLVTVSSLLTALQSLPAQQQARKALLSLMVSSQKNPLASVLGGRLRVKTWTWHNEKTQAQREGGFAGWLMDGTPVWARGQGTSKTVLTTYASALNKALPVTPSIDPGECVDSQLFARYPIEAVYHSSEMRMAGEGRLLGNYRVMFKNGNQLNIRSQGELHLQQVDHRWQIVAHLSREEYVARVLEREASTKPPEAAKALAVVIRTYLQQQASHTTDCLYIEDSSARQRIAPHPASATAREIAHWTEGLVLSGSPVQYHGYQASDNTLSWRKAVALAVEGMRYDIILAQVWPQSTLSSWERVVSECRGLPEARAWLLKQQKIWRKTLDLEPGYAETTHFAICRLEHAATPWVDRQRRRIYIRDFMGIQDRLDLAHEYLHLAFNGYPSGLDEEYIEQLTRRLLLE